MVQSRLLSPLLAAAGAALLSMPERAGRPAAF